MKKIVYIGNNLKNSNPTTLKLLSEKLKGEGYQLKIFSNKKNKILRVIDMLYGVSVNFNSNFILIDTYSTFNFYYAYLISILARVLNISYIPILHGGDLPKRINKTPRLCKSVFENSKINIAPSNYLYNKFQDFGFRVKYIPNTIELENYTFKPQRKYSKIKLLYVRAIEELYNPLLALKIVKELKNLGENVELLMVGPFKDKSIECLKEYVSVNKIKDEVEFTGALSKQEWIKKSNNYNVFINTTTVDNTPVSVIEAMALGLPVVSTNVGGLPYLIENNVDGILVDNDNELQFVEAILQLKNNALFRTNIIESARNKVEKFGWKEVKYKWLDLLN